MLELQYRPHASPTFAVYFGTDRVQSGEHIERGHVRLGLLGRTRTELQACQQCGKFGRFHYRHLCYEFSRRGSRCACGGVGSWSSHDSNGQLLRDLNRASGSNFTTARAYYAVNVFDAAGAGATNSYGLYVDSPQLLSAATVSHQYGVYIADQTLAGSGTNSDPWGVYEASAGSKNQFGTSTFTGELTTLASSTGGSGFNLPLVRHRHLRSMATVGRRALDCFVRSQARRGPYGSGTGSVSSVSNSDGTLTVSPTTGVVVASLALGHANTWTATQTLPSPILTGTPDASSATQFKLPVAAGFTSLANGECGFDSTGLNWHCWNGADALMVPLAPGFTSGDCGEPTLAGGKWTNVDTGSPCGTSSGANPALSNLASVSVNTSLLAQTGVDLGSTTKPFRNVFVFGSGTYGTNYFELTGTPTGTRVFTLPDVANDTFVMLAATQSLTNKTLDGVTPTTMGYVDATSSIQTQLNAKGSGTVTSFSAGTLSPLFTTSVATATSTPALTFSLSNAAQNSVFAGPASGGVGAPSYQTAPTISAANMTSFPTLNQNTTGTAANLAGCIPSAAGDICYYTGSAWTKLAGNPGSTNWLQETSSGTPSWTTPPGTIGSGTTDGVAYYTASTTIGSQTPPTANGIYSVIYNVTASAAVAPTASLGGVPVNAQTGTSYTYLYSDRASRVTFSNASAIAATLPQAGSTGFTSNWVNVSCDIGVGTATITPTTSNISYTDGVSYTSGASSLPLATGQCAWIYSDNTNYYAILQSGNGSTLNGGTIPASALLTGTNSSKQIVAAGLTSAHFYVGNGSNLPVDVAASGDVSLTNAGLFTVTQIEAAAIPTSASVVGTNASKQLVADTAHNIITPLACADSSGSGTAQSCTTTPSFTPAAGDCVIYTSTTANTGTGLTVNVNSLGAKSIAKWQATTTLAANDLLANKETRMCYDGTNWEMDSIGNPPAAGGGNTITSPNSTLSVGGSSSATTLDLVGGAGEIMAGATPALTYTPSLGKSGTAGTLSLFPASGNFTTTLGSTATANNTVDFFATVPTNLHLFYCAVSSTTCTLTDAGYAYNALPAADIAAGNLASGVDNSASLPLTGTVASGTAAMGTSAISSGACATVVTVSATGVATTDAIRVGFNTDPTAITGYGASATGAVLTIYPYPTANNVNFKVCNSSSGSITPSALTLNWEVAR